MANGMDEALEEYIHSMEGLDVNVYRNSYNDVGDVVYLLSTPSKCKVGVALKNPYFSLYSDAIDYMEDLKNHYYFERVANMEGDLIDIIHSFMKQYLNTEGKRGIENLAKKIWALNSRFKYFETNYHNEKNEDLAVSYETKEPYVVPLKIPVYNKMVKGYSANLAIDANVDRFLKVTSTIFKKRRIRDAFTSAIAQVNDRVIQQAGKQMKINFPNIKPSQEARSTANRPKVRIDISMPSIKDIRVSGKNPSPPEIKVRLVLVVTDENDPADILWSSQYVEMLDKHWEDIIEKFLQLFDIDKRQERLNVAFRETVLHKDEDYLKSKGLMSGQVNERRRRIKIKIK